MSNSQLSLHQYNMDKIANHCFERYDPFFTSFADKKISLFELDIHKGGPLLLWRDYFPLDTMANVDINIPKEFKTTERIYLFEGSQADPCIPFTCCK